MFRLLRVRSSVTWSLHASSGLWPDLLFPRPSFRTLLFFAGSYRALVRVGPASGQRPVQGSAAPSRTESAQSLAEGLRPGRQSAGPRQTGNGLRRLADRHRHALPQPAQDAVDRCCSCQACVRSSGDIFARDRHFAMTTRAGIVLSVMAFPSPGRSRPAGYPPAPGRSRPRPRSRSAFRIPGTRTAGTRRPR